MKKIVYVLTILIATFNVFAQPDYINFQSVLRDKDNKLVIDKSVSLRISLLKNSDVGTILYRESHNVITNSNGIATIQIGSGNSDIGNYLEVEWANDNVFVKVEINIDNSSYIPVGTTQLLAVPYALFAKHSSGSSNTIYTAGDGIKIENNVISNTKPDREVTIVGTDGIRVSGIYPNFLIADTSKTGNGIKYHQGEGISIRNDSIINTLPDKIVLLNGSNGIQISGTYPEFTISMMPSSSGWHPFDSTDFLIKGAGNINSSYNNPLLNIKGSRVLWLGDKAAFRSGWTLLSNDVVNNIDTNVWHCDSIGIYSAAFGNSNLAKGTQSFATGKFNKLYGENTFSSGYLNVVNYRNGAAFGEKNKIAAENSMAIGNSNSISGSNAFILGLQNVTTHSNSINSGYNNLCEADNSIIIGQSNNVSGTNSVSMGFNNYVTGESSFAVGINNKAQAPVSIAIGSSSSATGISSIAIGSNATASGERSVAMGTSANTNAKTGAFVLADGNIDNVLATNDNQITMRFAGGYRLFTNNNATIGAVLNSNSNSWATISDSTKKENFIKADGTDFLNKISKLNLGSWNYKEDNKNNRHYGAFAQEIFSLFGKDSLGIIGNDWSIASADMDGIILIGIQELINQNKNQQSEIDKLKAQIELLLNEIDQLKKK
ncbi:MAG: tail fiber domain-containing protein [Bacteroidetes bacterium]|nr:tail fiber domain-containing protein [Bacteroidota bacterium]